MLCCDTVLQILLDVTLSSCKRNLSSLCHTFGTSDTQECEMHRTPSYQRCRELWGNDSPHIPNPKPSTPNHKPCLTLDDSLNYKPKTLNPGHDKTQYAENCKLSTSSQNLIRHVLADYHFRVLEIYTKLFQANFIILLSHENLRKARCQKNYE